VTSRAPIGLGDLVTALRVLGVNDDATRGDVTRLLGLERDLPATKPSGPVRTSPEAIPSGDLPGRRIETLLEAEVGEHAAHVPTDLVPLPLANVPPSPRLGRKLRVTSTTGDIEIEPLFDPRWSRILVVGIAQTEAATGLIDLEALVGTLARARPVQHLPRKSGWTLRRGAQVLIDLGEAMLPFTRDQERLVGQLRDLVGKERLEEVRFEGCPAVRQHGADPSAGWYRPPHPGTPVVVLTDLGVGRPPPGSVRATIADWMAGATVIQRGGSTVVALVPYPIARVPRSLRRVVAVVTWDRSTTPSSLRKILRGATVSVR
jgi:hypothetical protein